jgi:cobalt-zinc-cadmium efflux system membrane fusion protein
VNRKILYVVLVAAVATLFAFTLWPRNEDPEGGIATEAKSEVEGEDHGENHVELSPESLKAVDIQTVEVVERESINLITVTGTVEADQQKIQQATPLVSGRVESVSVILGDRVRKGAVLAVISSPEVAEMHGKLHESETRLNLARQALERVQRAENRAGVIQAKARLDEADANLRRTRRLNWVLQPVRI